MTGKTSWTVKGIDPAARELAKRQARKAGVTIGTWLNDTIQNSQTRAQAQADTAANARIDVEALASRLELLEARLAETAGGIERNLQNVEMSVVSGFAELDRRTATARAQTHEVQASRPRTLQARTARRRPLPLITAGAICLAIASGFVFMRAYMPDETEKVVDALTGALPMSASLDRQADADASAPSDLSRIEPAAGPGATSGTPVEAAELPYQQALKLIGGKDGNRDSAQAEKLFEAAARQGHVPAQLRLADLYLQPDRSAADGERGLFWLMKAAGAGETEAEYRLALLYAAGDRVARNYRQAVTWFQRAADDGHVDAQYNLGLLYMRGMGVKRDVQIAHEWFSIAADNGDNEAGRKRDELALLLTATRGGFAADAIPGTPREPQTIWQGRDDRLAGTTAQDSAVLRKLAPLLGHAPQRVLSNDVRPAVGIHQ